MNYCKECCQTLTRPNLYVSEEGICGACLWEDEKKRIDWDKRHSELVNIAEEAKVKAQKIGTYDVVLGVSGGKDSIFTALYAKEKLNLNCLLVSAFPDEITDIGRHNWDNLVNQGFDALRIHVNPKLLAELMKRDFFKYLHFRKATEYPLWASTNRVAIEKKVPLIIQGENAALTLGTRDVENDASMIYKTNTIAGGTAIEHYSEYSPNQLFLYQFPDMTEWRDAGNKAIFLNCYVEEYSPNNNAKFALKRGLRYREDNIAKYGSPHFHTCLDSPFHSVSQMYKYYKLGFGFVTDAVCYNIREGLMTREDGFELIKKYDGKCGKDLIKHFCDFIGITEKEHWDTVAKFKKYDPWNRWKEQTEGIL